MIFRTHKFCGVIGAACESCDVVIIVMVIVIRKIIIIIVTMKVCLGDGVVRSCSEAADMIEEGVTR